MTAEFVKRAVSELRENELRRLSVAIISLVAIPVTLESALTDMKLYGFHERWLLLRLGIIPVGLLAIGARKTRLGGRFAAFPVLIVSLYIAGLSLYLVTQTDYENSLYFHNYVQILFALAMLPLSPLVFFGMTAGIIGSYFTALLVARGTEFWSVLTHKGLVFTQTYVIVSGLCFWLATRVRNALYARVIELDRELHDREATIDKQALDLSKMQVQAAVGRMSQMLAHDVRRPFSVLKAALAAIHRAPSDEEVAATVRGITSDVERAAAAVDGLVLDVMEVGRPNSLAVSAVFPEELISDCLREASILNPNAALRMVYDLAHDGPVIVDRCRVGRVLSNIVENAVHATSGRGTLWIRTARRGSEIEFSVINDGPPIPSEDVHTVFDAFFSQSKSKGTGLGLAVARQVVEAHGGRIWCVARTDGTEFRFTLPRASERRPSPTKLCGELPSRLGGVTLDVAGEPDGRRQQEGNCAILALVDDFRGLLPGWKSAVAGTAEVRYFCSPAAFFEAAGAAEFLERLQVVVTDYQFDGSDETGVEFAGKLRDKALKIPIVLSSGGFLARTEIGPAVDVVIDKTPLPWDELESLIARATALAPSARPLWARDA